MSGLQAQVKTLRRWTIGSIFISFVLYALICFDKREFVVLKETVSDIKLPEQIVPPALDLSAYIKRGDLMPSAIKGYKTKEKK